MTWADLIAALLLFIALLTLCIWEGHPYRLAKYQFLDRSPEINFEKFLKLYNLSPDKWELCEGYVIYDEEPICFFRYKEFRKYTKWYRTFKKDSIARAERLRETLNSQKKADIESEWRECLCTWDSNGLGHNTNGET